MKEHKARAIWKGSVKHGEGKLETGSGVLESAYDFNSRFEDGKSTTPEELIGAAHAGCFSMALALALGEDGHEPKSIDTRAEVRLKGPSDGEPAIEQIRLITEASVPGIEERRFLDHAESARKNCIVSRALSGIDIALDARLVQS